MSRDTLRARNGRRSGATVFERRMQSPACTSRTLQCSVAIAGSGFLKVRSRGQLGGWGQGSEQIPCDCATRQEVRNGEIPLREGQVRLVRAEEVPRWSAMMRRQHYLGFRRMCGRRLRHVAVRGERWIVWSSLQRRACDWLAVHGHAILPTASLADPARFAGTCCRASNWTEVGATRGFGRVRGPLNYVRHGSPKRVFPYPLRRAARQQLRPEGQPWRPRMQRSNRQLASLRQALHEVPDRRGQRGRRYPLTTVLTIVPAARLDGCQTLTETSGFGRALSLDVLRRIGSRLRPQAQRYDVRSHRPFVTPLALPRLPRRPERPSLRGTHKPHGKSSDGQNTNLSHHPAQPSRRF